MISSQGKMKELKVSLMKKCKEMEIPLVGIASVERWGECALPALDA